MSIKKIKLAYGKDQVEFEIDEGLMAGPVLDTKKPAIEPMTAVPAIAKALENPVGRPRLRDMCKGKIVGIVISDEFRAGLQKEISTALVNECAAGNPKQIKVFVATGSHDPVVYAKNLKPYMEKDLAALKCPSKLVLHDCDKSEFVEIGKTSTGTVMKVNKELIECDLRVYGHESKHHYMCGYSNLDKQIIPGVSSRRTIEMNHKNSLDHEHAMAGRSPWHSNPDRQFNPFAVDARNGRALSENSLLLPDGTLKKGKVDTFGLDMASEKDKVYWIKAGDPEAISKEMTSEVDKLASNTVEKMQYVIISPGGPPASQALYGVQNCFDMALKGAIADGGEALVIAPCNGRPDLPPDVSGLAPDKKSKELFWDNLVRLRDKPLAECSEFIDKHFELYLWKTDRVVKLLKSNKVKLYLYCELPADLLKSAGIEKAESIQKWIDERAARKNGKFRIINNGNKLLVMPK